MSNIRLRAILALTGLAALAPTGSAAAPPPGCASAGDTVTCTYSFTGALQDFTVPAGVTSVAVDVGGAQGASSAEPGGKGADVQGTLAVSPGQVLTLTVAGQGQAGTGGFGGGADGGPGATIFHSGKGGGGASRIAIADSVLVVAAGGGGAAGGAGGDSGSPGSGRTDLGSAAPGAAGTQSAGGAGGAGGVHIFCTGGIAGLSGSNGGFSSGGAGASGARGDVTLSGQGGGGGGGGYYGGGGGGGGYFCPINSTGGWGGGGGGGSSYIDGAVTVATLRDGAQSGNGVISLTFLGPDSSPPVDDPAVSGTVGSNGWYAGDVTVDWNWSDARAGIDASACTQSSTTTSEGAAVDLSSSCQDLAGNAATDSRIFQIDKTAPTVTCLPTSFPLGSSGGTVGASVTDELSGPTQAAVSVQADARDAGEYTAPLTGVDNAGNSTTVSCPYTVAYGLGGFSSPKPNSTLRRSRSTIPVKFVLTDSSGQAIAASTAAALTAAGKVRATLDGPAISAHSATCRWNSRRRYFECAIPTPSGVQAGTRSPYTITASEDVGAGFITAPPVGAATNPTTIYFK